MRDANLLTSELLHKQWSTDWFMEYDYKLNVEFLKEYRLKILPNKS